MWGDAGPFLGPSELEESVVFFSAKIEGLARLVQSLCMMNYISVMFAKFWCANKTLRGALNGEQTSSRFSDAERLKFDQQYAFVSYYFGDVSVDYRDWSDGEKVLFFARHMMKKLHAGAIIQAVLYLIRSCRSHGCGIGKLLRADGEQETEPYSFTGMEMWMSRHRYAKVSRKTSEYWHAAGNRELSQLVSSRRACRLSSTSDGKVRASGLSGLVVDGEGIADEESWNSCQGSNERDYLEEAERFLRDGEEDYVPSSEGGEDGLELDFAEGEVYVDDLSGWQNGPAGNSVTMTAFAEGQDHWAGGVNSGVRAKHSREGLCEGGEDHYLSEWKKNRWQSN